MSVAFSDGMIHQSGGRMGDRGGIVHFNKKEILNNTRKSIPLSSKHHTLMKPRYDFSTSGLQDLNSGPVDFYGKPFFGPTNTDVLVQEGNHAFFHCAVHNIGNQTVNNKISRLTLFMYEYMM